MPTRGGARRMGAAAMALFLAAAPLTAQPENPATAPPFPEADIPAVTETAPAYSLPQLVSIALANNPETSRSWSLALAADAEVGAAKSEYLPTIDFTAIGLTQYFQQPEYPGAGYGRQILGGPSLELSYLLLDFGGRDARVAQAQARMVANNYQHRQIVQDTLLQVLAAYADVAAARALLDAAQAQHAFQDLSFAAVETGFLAGLYIEAQRLEAASLLEQARARVQAARSLLASTVGRLNTTLGQEANQALRTEDLPPALPIRQVDQGIDVLIQQSLKSRPEIAVAFAEVRVSDERIREVESTYWPTISLDLLGLITPESTRGNALGTPYHVTKPPITAAATVTIEWELFDGFYRENKVQQARDQAQAARHNLRLTELTTVQEVWTAYHDYLAASRDLLFREASLAAVDARLQIAEEGVSSGLANDLQLAEAIAMQRAASAAEVQARAVWLTTAVRLVYATGRLTPAALR